MSMGVRILCSEYTSNSVDSVQQGINHQVEVKSRSNQGQIKVKLNISKCRKLKNKEKNGKEFGQKNVLYFFLISIRYS